MKKYTILFLLIMLTGIIAADVYTIGDGTTTQNYIPAYGLYDYGWSRMIYTAAEMSATGFSAADSWIGIGFQVGNEPTDYTLYSQTMYMRHTTASSFTTSEYPNSADYTQVFIGDLLFDGPGWYYVIFDTPFAWDGSSNIEIFWENNDGDWDSGHPMWCYTATTEDMAIYKYTDGTFPTTDGTLTTNRPNLQLLTPDADPPDAATLIAPEDNSTIGTMQAQLAWAAPASGAIHTGYKLYLGTTTPPPFVADLGLATTYQTGVLPFDTVHYWQVVPYNSVGDATGCPIWSFTSMPDPTITAADLPHLENFDGVTAPDLPGGWETVLNSTSSYAKAENRTSGTPNSPPNHIYMYNSSDTAAELMLISPPIDVALNTLRVKFYGKGEASLNVFVGTYNAGVFTAFETLSIPANYAQYTVDFSDYTGTDNRIAFKLDTSTTYRDLYIDDVVFEIPAPDPPEPATVAFPLNGMTTLVDPLLQWTPSPTGEPATSYKVYLNQSGTFGPADIVYEGEDLQYQTSGLDYIRTYFWKVEPTNAYGADPSCPTWSFVVVSSDQLAENFEDTAFPPAGWANGSSGNWTRSTTSPNFEGSAQAYKYTSTSNAYQLSTPMVTIYNGDTLDFWTRATNTSQILQIAYSDDRETWTQIGADISYAATGVWYSQSVDLSALAGNNYYLAFYAPIQSTTGSIFVDYVIGPNITPLTPGVVTLDSPAAAATDQSSYPTFDWEPDPNGGVPTGYNLYLDTIDGSTLYASDVMPPYTPDTALEYETTYYWTVAAYNNAGTGEQAEVRSFTTMSDPTIYVLPWTEGFDTYLPPNWTEMSGIYPAASGTSSSWLQDDWLNDTSTGNQAARVNIYGTSMDEWLITPPIVIPAGDYELMFDLGLTDYANSTPIEDPTAQEDDKFIVAISDTPTMANPTVLRQWDNAGSAFVYNQIPHTGEIIYIDLSAHSGTKYIAFYGESTVSGGDNDLFVDNVTVRLTPEGPPDPVTLVAPEDGATGLPVDGFNLSWSPALTGGTPTSYSVFMSQTEDNIYTDYFWDGIETTSFDPTQADLNPVVFAYEETWYWTVRANNGDGSSDLGATDIYSFTIMPDPRILSLPYSQNFDGVDAPELPAQWIGMVNPSSTSYYVNNYSSTTYSVSPPNTVKMYNYNSTTADIRLISPEILVPMNTIKLSFSARGSTGYTLLVGTVDTNDETGTFNQLASLDLTTTHTVYTLSLADYTGTDQYICFQHGLGSTYRSIYIDDVSMEELVPNDLAVTSFGGDTMGILGDELSYQVSVYNNGTATQNAYDIQLLSVDSRTLLATLNVTDPLAAGATAEHSILWTPAATGVYEVYAKIVLTGDVNTYNDESDIVTVGVYPATSYLPFVGDIESTTTSYYTPFTMYYKNNLAETIYLAHEMQMTSGTINAIVYHNNFTQDLNNIPVKIWMQHTTESVNAAWLPYADYTLVFDGTVSFPAGVNSIVIPLQTPFEYTGGNLAVRTNRVMDTQYYSSSDKFYYTLDANYPDRTRYYYNDSTEIDPSDPSATATGTQSNYIPNTGFIVDPASPVTALAAPELSFTHDGTEATISWDAIPYAYCYQLYTSADPYTWDTEPTTVYATEVTVPTTEPKGFCKVVAQSYAHEPASRILNPAAVLGFDNSSLRRNARATIGTENKD